MNTKMRYAIILSAIFSCGCSAQMQDIFTLREPAHYYPLEPNHAQEHDRNLQRAIARAIERQEAADGLQMRCHTQPATIYCSHLWVECK